jgi:DNA-binding XRE family transcriptional regulator
VTRVDEATCQRGYASRGEAEAVTELARGEAAGCREVLERRELDLVDAGLTGPRGALVLAREIDAAQQPTEPLGMSDWLCTHWLTSSRMRRVKPEERFAANLRRIRTDAGMSQEQLAGRTGLHPTEISRLERAVREPRLGTIVRLARGLDVGVERLVSGIR